MKSVPDPGPHLWPSNKIENRQLLSSPRSAADEASAAAEEEEDDDSAEESASDSDEDSDSDSDFDEESLFVLFVLDLSLVNPVL